MQKLRTNPKAKSKTQIKSEIKRMGNKELLDFFIRYRMAQVLGFGLTESEAYEMLQVAVALERRLSEVNFLNTEEKLMY
jgi:hypothetical protein